MNWPHPVGVYSLKHPVNNIWMKKPENQGGGGALFCGGDTHIYPPNHTKSVKAVLVFQKIHKKGIRCGTVATK